MAWPSTLVKSTLTSIGGRCNFGNRSNAMGGARPFTSLLKMSKSWRAGGIGGSFVTSLSTWTQTQTWSRTARSVLTLTRTVTSTTTMTTPTTTTAAAAEAGSARRFAAGQQWRTLSTAVGLFPLHSGRNSRNINNNRTRWMPLGGNHMLLKQQPQPQSLAAAAKFIVPAQQTRGMASKKHKRIIKMAKGYRGRANRCYKIAINRVEKALQYAYRDRKQRKREFRKLWIERINAGVRQHHVSYSKFIHQLHDSGVQLDRKILADLAMYEPFSFKAVVDVVKMRSTAATTAPSNGDEEASHTGGNGNDGNKTAATKITK